MHNLFMKHGLFGPNRIDGMNCRRNLRRIVEIEFAQQLVFEIENRLPAHHLAMPFEFLQLLDCGPIVIADDAGKLGQWIIIRQYAEIRSPASCQLFLCHPLHSQVLASHCQFIVGKW